MRLHLGNALAVTLIAATLTVTGCKPNYPACNSDEHCAEKGEVCINKECQECGDDSQCAAKYPGEDRECVGGRCDVKPECRLDDDCESVGAGLVCRGNKCVAECATDEDCPAGAKCENQTCIAECEQDVDCGPGRVCANGMCQDEDRGGTEISSACRPMGGGGDVVSLDTVNFDFNQYDLTVSARGALDQNAECMNEAPGVTIVIEGHCDERGTQEYNLALGEKRANTVKSYLRNLGVKTSRMRTRSKGENEPTCRRTTEACWSENRRVEFIQSR
ncbi:MAG: OmpA family protein [Myxococcota bacterium]